MGIIATGRSTESTHTTDECVARRFLQRKLGEVASDNFIAPQAAPVKVEELAQVCSATTARARPRLRHSENASGERDAGREAVVVTMVVVVVVMVVVIVGMRVIIRRQQNRNDDRGDHRQPGHGLR